MADYFQIYRKTAAAWTAANPTLLDGQLAFETDTKKWKIGDGTTAWVSLAYLSASAGGALLAANNLSDLVTPATARTNLGLGTIATKAATTGSAVQKADGSGGLTGATPGTDFYNPGGTDVAIADGGTGTSSLPTGILKGAGTGAITAATASIDYAPATTGSSSLKGNGSGGFSAATLNDNGAPTADFSMASHKLTNVTDPTSAQDASTKNYHDVNQFEALPSWHGLLGWTFDFAAGAANTVVPNAGVMNLCKVWLPGPITISTIWTFLAAGGTVLANVGFALYNSSGTLLTSSINANGATATAFQSAGAKQVTITPQAVSGSVYVGFWFGSATTLPNMTRGSTVAIINANLTTPNLRFSTTGSGLTTTAPSPMGTQLVTNAVAWWVGVS